jgi:hypothetical protein
VMGVFEIRFHKLFAWTGFEPQSSWSLPPEWLGLQTWAMAPGYSSFLWNIQYISVICSHPTVQQNMRTYFSPGIIAQSLWTRSPSFPPSHPPQPLVTPIYFYNTEVLNSICEWDHAIFVLSKSGISGHQKSPEILATWEAEMGRIVVRGQPGQTVLQIQLQNKQSKMDWRCGSSGRAPALPARSPGLFI